MFYNSFSGFLTDLYKQNFTFIKQQHRYVEYDIDSWSPNILQTGTLQVIAIFELINDLRENGKQKKRRLK